MNGRIVLIGGGVRSGKSAFALARARELGDRRLFVATAEAGDDAMATRIAAHRSDRGDDFRTIEEPVDIARVLRVTTVTEADVVLVDCMTLWLSNLLCRGDDNESVLDAIDDLCDAVHAAPFATVLVTNEVGMGVIPASELGIRFRDLAGRAHQRLAAVADEIYLAALGTLLRLRPGPIEAILPGGERDP